MNILVYLKEVPPKEEQVKYQTAEGISDSDKNVLKEALNLRDQEGGHSDSHGDRSAGSREDCAGGFDMGSGQSGSGL
ncbi:hypothetical protein ABMC10_10555 [Anaerostipes caccae]|uniref:hypothetical protein n=1 Tax=Anaerostipes caccae TaxID=105841 RepID=UPI002670BD53|nr:hypothetical protein [Anaerostipes caccae]